MQKYDFTAPANGAPQIVNVPGRYIKYVTGNAGGNDTGLIVTPGGKPGSKILLYPGQAVTLPNDGTAGPNAWTIANALGAAQIVGTVVVGNGRIDDNTLQGVVQVVDGGKSRTLNNSAFGACATSAAVASQYSRVQLWNPANSGVRLVLEAITLNGGASTEGVALVFNTAALATQASAGVSKRAAGAASAASTLRTDSTAAVFSGTQILAQVVAANTVVPYKFSEPIVIDPGHGLLAWGGTANDSLGVSFEWYEEPNV